MSLMHHRSVPQCDFESSVAVGVDTDFPPFLFPSMLSYARDQAGDKHLNSQFKKKPRVTEVLLTYLKLYQYTCPEHFSLRSARTS